MSVFGVGKDVVRMNRMHNFVERVGKCPLPKPQRRWKENTKMENEEVSLEYITWM